MHTSAVAVPTADYALTVTLLLAVIVAMSVYRLARYDQLVRIKALAVSGSALVGTFYLLLRIAQVSGVG
ncbi:hypothetical protein GXW82_16025 [Streptacidiphilus sp. 4-A2]|nr:hypothetical protein [Streptacidiphilus sp. 4-A2]